MPPHHLWFHCSHEDGRFGLQSIEPIELSHSVANKNETKGDENEAHNISRKNLSHHGRLGRLLRKEYHRHHFINNRKCSGADGPQRTADRRRNEMATVKEDDGPTPNKAAGKSGSPGLWVRLKCLRHSSFICSANNSKFGLLSLM